MKLLLIQALSLFSAAPISQSNPVCGQAADAVKLMKDYDEEAVFTGTRVIDADRQQITLVLISSNKRTGSWSLFEGYDNNQVCLIQSGIGGKSIAPLSRNML